MKARVRDGAIHSRPDGDMKWSWQIGRIAGIRLRVHVTFPLLIVLLILGALARGTGPATLFGTVALVLAVFAVVVLHECGHALVARRFGIHTRDILLLPIGGIARLERMPRDPRQEFLIAVAGPAVNVVLAGVLFVILVATGHSDAVAASSNEGARITLWTTLARLFVINLSLAAFNLLPAFPMDGGRVLRAVLAIRSRDYARATRAAARVGRVFALIFGVTAMFVLGNPLLVVIAVFIWVAAGSEATMVQTAAALEQVRLEHLMMTDVRTLTPNDQLQRAARLTMEGSQQDFPVVDGRVLVGMLTRRDLVRGLAEGGTTRLVESAMQRDYPTASPDDAVDHVLHQLAALGTAALPIVRGGELIGLLTMENVQEFLMLRAADPAAVRSS